MGPYNVFFFCRLITCSVGVDVLPENTKLLRKSDNYFCFFFRVNTTGQNDADNHVILSTVLSNGYKQSGFFKVTVG